MDITFARPGSTRTRTLEGFAPARVTFDVIDVASETIRVMLWNAADEVVDEFVIAAQTRHPVTREVDWDAVHDAARDFITHDLGLRVIADAEESFTVGLVA